MTATLVHSLPDRLRVVVPRIRRDPRAATMLREELRRIPGIRSVAARTVTGSVVVEHDGREGLHHTILDALGAGRQPTAAPVPDSPAMRLAEICLERLLEAWLERALRAAVGLA